MEVARHRLAVDRRRRCSLFDEATQRARSKKRRGAHASAEKQRAWIKQYKNTTGVLGMRRRTPVFKQALARAGGGGQQRWRVCRRRRRRYGSRPLPRE